MKNFTQTSIQHVEEENYHSKTILAKKMSLANYQPAYRVVDSTSPKKAKANKKSPVTF